MRTFKGICLIVFGASAGFGLVAAWYYLRHGFGGVEALAWFGGAFVAALLGMYADEILGSFQNEDAERCEYDPPPRSRRQDGQQFAVVGNAGNGNNLAAGWGDAAVNGLQNHGWLIAGLLLAASAFWATLRTVTTNEPATFFMAAVLLTLASNAFFLVYAGKLGDSLAGVAKYPAVVWLVLSVLALVLSVMMARQEGVPVSSDWFVWIAAVSTFLAVLAVAGQLGSFFQAVGTGIGKAYGFGYHPFLSLVLWGVTLIALYLFASSYGEAFGLEVSDQALNTLKLFAAAGWFTIIFAPLVFKKK